MPCKPHLIVWDFDGVLNDNARDGRYRWKDTLERDLGIDPEAFSATVFRTPTIRAAILGGRDLRDEIAQWLADTGHGISVDTVLDYWFTKDAAPDAEVIGWMTAARARCVIGTNNEPRRARFIETTLGFGALVERIFASGDLGVAKPDPGFFAAIERWSGLTPPDILPIDDSATNIAACTARGWQGFHFTPASRAILPKRLGLA